MALLEIANLQKGFVAPDGQRRLVIDVPEFALEACGERALRGPSGSGKTTLLNLIAGILQPDRGSIRLDRHVISSLSESGRDRLRAKTLGYIFQTFNLLQGYTCLENVLLAMSFGHRTDRAFAETLLRRVGLADHLRHFPRQLSTGQQQRVAVARALANHPKLVLADEPTGNLDARAAAGVLDLIREVCRENQAALLVVSHDSEVLNRFAHVLDLQQINRAAQTDAPPEARS